MGVRLTPGSLIVRKILICLSFIIFLFLAFPSKALAIYDPLSVPNNKFGIHIGNENDFDNASKVVNTSGGDWGYVTFVITEGERNTDRWQQAFNQARRLHLIPIIRIATKASGNKWEIPQEGEIDNWVSFLTSLNWVTENRYVVIGNEPNQSLEWGGKIDPEGYGRYLLAFSSDLKASNSDFFVLPAGFDAAAGNTRSTMSEKRFLDTMLSKVPNAFDNIDGWASHSYPSTGIDTFVSELSYLKAKGISKELPVFITETGWQLNAKGTNQVSLGKYYDEAFKTSWSDPRVVAVTPFILNYPQPPFDRFSWQKSDGSFYDFVKSVQDIPKIQGKPTQRVSGSILALFLPSFDFENSEVKGAVLVKNTGQSIWNNEDIDLLTSGNGFTVLNKYIPEIEPGHVGVLTFTGKTPKMVGTYRLYLGLTSNGNTISNIYLTWLTNLIK